MYNEKTYRLSIRKSLLLLYHDSETDGAHANVEQTFAKVSRHFKWPGMGKDVQNWCNTCSICRLVRPQRTLTAQQRSELHDRPFRVLFIDTLGPISPEGENGELYIFHSEDLFGRDPVMRERRRYTDKT